MVKDFKCPRCKKLTKVSRLRSSYQCPHCNLNMLITPEEKQAGRSSKDYYKNFLNSYRER